jgi:hypothetical protein
MVSSRRTLLIALAALAPGGASWARQGSEGVRIPFRRDNGMVTIEVVIEGRPALAVIDNGAAFSLVDPVFFQRVGRLAQGSLRLNGEAAQVANPMTVNVGGARLVVSPAISDLTQFSGALGKPVVMVLGYELFAAWIVQFDFGRSEMVLHAPQGFRPPRGVRAINLTALPGRKFAAPLHLGFGKTVPAMIDLGASSAVAVSTPLAQRWGLSRLQPQSTAAASVFIGDRPQLFVSHLVTAPPLHFAGLTLRGAPVEILAPDEPVFSRYGATVGAPVLSRYDLWLDLAGKRMWARARRDATAPFERDRIGLQGYVDGDTFRIMHVRESSPAARAKLSSTDRVATINGRPAGEMIGELKYAAPAGKTYELGLADGRQVSLVGADFY